MNNMFEFAARFKLRFPSSRGELTAEQLWDIPLRSRDDFNLDTVAKAVNKALKTVSEESFVEVTKTTAHTRGEVALELVKYVIGTKLDEEMAAKKRADNKVEREKLLQILAEKQAGKLFGASINVRGFIISIDAENLPMLSQLVDYFEMVLSDADEHQEEQKR